MPQILKAFLFVLATFGTTFAVSMLVAVIIRLISLLVQRKPSQTGSSPK